MTNEKAIRQYFESVIEYWKGDAESRGQKMPQNFKIVVDQEGGSLIGPSHFKFLVHGRGPGKFPPPADMVKYVQDNPDQLAEAKQIWKHITESSLAYLIGRKIAKEGTDIYKGVKKGIDFEGGMERFMPVLLNELMKNQLLKIKTVINEARSAA